jgi:hypothetical protein
MEKSIKMTETLNQIQTRQSRAAMHIETQLIMNFLATKEIGACVSYSEIAHVAGLSELPISRHPREYGRLFSARRALEMQGIFFDCISKDESFYGIKRISEAEAVSKSQKGLSHIRKRSRLETRRLAAIPNYTELDKDSKVRWNVNMTLFKLINGISKAKTVKQVSNKIKNDTRIFNFGETLKLFGMPQE